MSDEGETVKSIQQQQGLKESKFFKYQPLESSQTIRILRLRHGRGNDPLRGTLEHTEYSDYTEFQSKYDSVYGVGARPYEALSYVWGPANYTHRLLCADGEHIAITENLAVALTHIRSPDRSRYLWVDAICINQADLQERGHQVRLMGQIYSKATQVLVWLGAGHDPKTYLRHEFSTLTRATQRDEYWLVKALAEISRSEWFSRLWVVQELLLSRSAVFLAGLNKIHSDYLEKPLQIAMMSSDHVYASVGCAEERAQHPLSASHGCDQRPAVS